MNTVQTSMIDTDTTIPIIILNVNGVNTAIKRQRLYVL